MGEKRLTALTFTATARTPKIRNTRWYLKDNSTNGTTLNGSQVSKGECCLVNNNDEVVFGSEPDSAEPYSVFKFYFQGVGNAPERTHKRTLETDEKRYADRAKHILEEGLKCVSEALGDEDFDKIFKVVGKTVRDLKACKEDLLLKKNQVWRQQQRRVRVTGKTEKRQQQI